MLGHLEHADHQRYHHDAAAETDKASEYSCYKTD
jgi:hypothetical protein